MGKYKNEPNIILKADCLLPVFIKAKVCEKNATPHTVATMAEYTPVMPNKAGSRPKGIRNIVYTII